MKNPIAKVVLGLPVEGPFDYKIPEDGSDDLQVGQRVVVPFGRRMEMGYIVGFAKTSELAALKSIKQVLDQEPIISPELMHLARWMADYYGSSFGEAIERMIPFSIRKKKKLNLTPQASRKYPPKKTDKISLFLSHDDMRCLKEVIRRAQDYLKKGQGVVFLAPDHMTSERLFEHISKELSEDVARLDRGTSKKQVEDWVSLKNGTLMCAVGLRSSVFAPVSNLGLAVVFEEHHYGYKEDQMPFYHAREVILKRAEIQRSDVIFVSCAPTVELWSIVTEASHKQISFPRDAESKIKLIDLTNYKPRKDSALSFPVANAVSQVLDRGRKVLVIFNRRGFHTMIKCDKCDHVLKCERCEVSFVYHYEAKQMVCPSCDKKYDAVGKCPECGEVFLHRYGGGVERVESDLAQFFPQAKLAIFDREAKRVPKSATILVATQAVFKVLDRLDVDTAVVLDVDAELSRNDFRSHQRVFSLLMDLKKVAGSDVFVQTRQPNHPALRYARFLDVETFYQEELVARKDLGFPPYQHLFEIMMRGKKEALVIEQADMIYEQFLENPVKGFEVMPPQPSFQAKLRDQYRYTIMGKGLHVEESIAHIKRVLKKARKKTGVIATINVDP